MQRLQRFSSSGTGYVYTNTRVRVLKSKLLSRDDMEKIMKMSISEIARFLQEREYKKEFDDLGRVLSGTNLIEYALNRNMENQFSSILRFSVRGARMELHSYLKRFDVMNIKTVLRGKMSGIKNDAILNELIVAGELNRQFFREILEKSKTFEDAVESFKGTKYYPVLKSNQSSMPNLEDGLDRLYYGKLLQNVSKPLAEFIKYEITAKNIALGARARRHGVEFKPLKGGRKIAEESIDSVELRTRLRKDFIQRALKIVSMFSRDIMPVVAYFIAKENEISNIRIVVRGKKAGLEEFAIRRQLVVGG